MANLSNFPKIHRRPNAQTARVHTIAHDSNKVLAETSVGTSTPISDLAYLRLGRANGLIEKTFPLKIPLRVQWKASWPKNSTDDDRRDT